MKYFKSDEKQKLQYGPCMKYNKFITNLNQKKKNINIFQQSLN